MKQITCPHCADTYPDFDVAHVCSKGPYAPKLKPKMNERIQALADEAEDYADSIVDQGGEFHPAYTQKLAELIVRECANICFSEAEGHSTAFGEHCGNVIKEHFGVE